jgi:YihY family inner membrane protein
MIHRIAGRWAEKFNNIFPVLDRATGGRLDALRNAIQSYNENRAGEAAASIAYYALFSLFPLLLFLIAGLSFILERETAKQQLLQYIRLILPVSQSFITTNIEWILRNRPTFGLVALVTFLWSGSGVFTTLAININRAWSEAHVRSFLHARLVALAMVGVLVMLLFISLFTSAIINLIAQFRLPIGGSFSLYNSPLFQILSNLLPLLARLFMFWGLYLWVPTTPVPWRAAFWGALSASLLWELIINLFTWYVSSGLVRYETFYGPLGTLIVLMLWIYLASSIALFGAHLTACLTKSKPGRIPLREVPFS